MFFVGYIHYFAMLLVAAGIFNVVVDGRFYKQHEMKKEKKTANVLGWSNIVLGCAAFIVYLFIS